MIKLLPQPKKIEYKDGFLSKKCITPQNGCSDSRIGKALEKLPLSECGVPLIINCSCGEAQSYRLNIESDKITIDGDGVLGVFYAIQTLRQIFENEKVPCLCIDDCPDMEHRGFYHDITRGKVPKLETLKNLVDEMAYYKYNSFQIYTEHTFEFREFGDNIYKTGYITADEIRELDDYCYENFIEFIPSIPTFSHLYELLELDQYKHLQALDGYVCENIRMYERQRHHTLDPINPESIELIKSMIDQYVVLFRTDKFNICCDEIFDMETGKYEGMNPIGLYVDFVKQIIAHLEAKGKKIMMWGDVLIPHPEAIKDLPEDTLFLNWDYLDEPNEDRVKLFADLGCTQYVCPGTGANAKFMEKVEYNGNNIVRLLDYGFKYGAKGMINTNWGDFGTPCSIEMSMHGLVLGAAKSWNKATERNEAFEESINFLTYKNSDCTKYLYALDYIHSEVRWDEFMWHYSNEVFVKNFDVNYPSEEMVIKTQNVCTDVINELSNVRWEKDKYRKIILIVAEGVGVMAELFAKVQGYKIERRFDTYEWLKRYRESWLWDNKESELREIEKIFRYYEEEV